MSNQYIKMSSDNMMISYSNHDDFWLSPIQIMMISSTVLFTSLPLPAQSLIFNYNLVWCQSESKWNKA